MIQNLVFLLLMIVILKVSVKLIIKVIVGTRQGNGPVHS